MYKCLDGAHAEPVRAVVVVERVNVAGIEVQVAAIGRAVRTGNPEVAVAADIVERPRTVVAVAACGP